MTITRAERRRAGRRMMRSFIALGVLYPGYLLVCLFGGLIALGEVGMDGMVKLSIRLNTWASRD